MSDYSTKQLDIIKEISNIALGDSATSLSSLLKCKIGMSVPNVNIEPINKFISNIDDSEVIGKILLLKGDIEGSILLLFNIDTAKKMVEDIVLDKSLTKDESDNMKISFIEEVCNIVCSTYIRNIADYLNINLEIEGGRLLYDNLTAILSYTLMEEEQFYEDVINIQTDFKYELNSEEMKVYFYFVPRKGNIDDKIFNIKG